MQKIRQFFRIYTTRWRRMDLPAAGQTWCTKSAARRMRLTWQSMPRVTHGRVVIGSWYGRKKSVLDLGGTFHRNRIQLVSSQVSSLAPEISGRWTKERRLALALQALHSLHPGEWITHRFPFTQADQAYQQLVLRPEESFQIVLTY